MRKIVFITPNETILLRADEEMANREILYSLSAVFLLGALAILIEQYLSYGRFIELKDVLHHEFFAFTLLAFALGILLAAYATAKK